MTVVAPISLAASAHPTRPQIEGWDITHLEAAAIRWRTQADHSERAFEQHRQNISAPGGTTWLGDAKDSALQRVSTDLGVVRRQVQVQRACSDVAINGSQDLRNAQRKTLEAIADAEADGYQVRDDLSVLDTRDVPLYEMVQRRRRGIEHSEYIRWNAEQLAAADAHIGTQLTHMANELAGISFAGGGDDDSVQMLDEHKPKDHELSEARKRAIAYADEWAGSESDPHKHNPDYANFGDGGGDCTNFASQVMRAGGFQDVGDGIDDWHRGDADDWYYNNGMHVPGNDRSNTWSVAQANRDFVTQQSNRGQIVGTAPMPSANSLDPLAPSKAGLVPGDLIYYRDTNGNINHTAVYVGQSMQNGVLTDVVDQHANGDNNFRNDWMPDGTDFIGGSASAEFVHLTYPGE
ncbi:amidase domain-containing protein [Mycolicibacterium cosmeticum]|uniref:amidase domain-containing protein n=1 Tax=Mycolicibacterium cosmeticum TaxID=258533 RepID=UPI0032048CD9